MLSILAMTNSIAFQINLFLASRKTWEIYYDIGNRYYYTQFDPYNRGDPTNPTVQPNQEDF